MTLWDAIKGLFGDTGSSDKPTIAYPAPKRPPVGADGTEW